MKIRAVKLNNYSSKCLIMSKQPESTIRSSIPVLHTSCPTMYIVWQQMERTQTLDKKKNEDIAIVGPELRSLLTKEGRRKFSAQPLSTRQEGEITGQQPVQVINTLKGQIFTKN